MKQRWVDAEEALLEHLDGRYVGKKFVSEYKRLAAIKKLPARSSRAITLKARELNITLNGAVFDSFSCCSLARTLGIYRRRVHVWVKNLNLPALKRGDRYIILAKDFVGWVRNSLKYLGGISKEHLFWLTGEMIEVPQLPQTKNRAVIRAVDKTVYPSIREAARQTFIGQYSIYRALRLGTEAGGSKWEYVCN